MSVDRAIIYLAEKEIHRAIDHRQRELNREQSKKPTGRIHRSMEMFLLEMSM